MLLDRCALFSRCSAFFTPLRPFSHLFSPPGSSDPIPNRFSNDILKPITLKKPYFNLLLSIISHFVSKKAVTLENHGVVGAKILSNINRKTTFENQVSVKSYENPGNNGKNKEISSENPRNLLTFSHFYCIINVYNYLIRFIFSQKACKS